MFNMYMYIYIKLFVQTYLNADNKNVAYLAICYFSPIALLHASYTKRCNRFMCHNYANDEFKLDLRVQ